jgi:hypothetical protein
MMFFLNANLVVRASTAEKSVIDIVDAANGPRLGTGADGAVRLLGAKRNGTKHSALSVKDKESATEGRASAGHSAIAGHSARLACLGQKKLDGLHRLKGTNQTWN